MARSKIIVVPFRRKRKGKTDYKKRRRLLMSEKPRLVVRKSLKNIWLQVVEYSPAGDKILVSAHSKELKKLGWEMNCGNVPSAYLTGMLLGKKAAEKKVKQAILDNGLYPSIKGNRVYAALKGVIDSGMDIPHSNDVFPSEDRISGKHIGEFAKKAKEIHASQFSKINAENIEKQFQEVKNKIQGK